MDRDKQLELKKKFPRLYKDMLKDKVGRPFWPMEAWGISVDNGWYDLIYELSEKLEKILQTWSEDELNSFQVVQVKEKWGCMNYNVQGATDEMFTLIQKAEEDSANICEECGKPGKIISGGWLKCWCAEHRLDRVLNNIKISKDQLKQFNNLPRNDLINKVVQERDRKVDYMCSSEEERIKISNMSVDEYAEVIRKESKEYIEYWENELKLCYQELSKP